MTETAQEQLKQLNDLYNEGHELYYKTSANMGLCGSSLMILYGLTKIGRPCTQKELCDTYFLKKQTLHSALQKLIKSNDVRMEPKLENSRHKLIVLTEKGHALCKKTAIPFVEAEIRAYERLNSEERELLYALTRKHTEFIKEEAAKLAQNYSIKKKEDKNVDKT